MDKSICLREANANDAYAISEIYKYYVDNTAVSFEITAPNSQEFTERIYKTYKDYPFIVAESDDKIVGYAYAHRYQQRQAYDWNAELSVYLCKDFRNIGVGSILYNALIEICKLQNIKNLYGIITLPNDASINLHKKFGFQIIGIYNKTGYKLGEWRDVAIAECVIGDKTGSPESVIRYSDIDKEEVSKILALR